MRSGPEMFHSMEEVDSKLLVPLRTKCKQVFMSFLQFLIPIFAWIHNLVCTVSGVDAIQSGSVSPDGGSGYDAFGATLHKIYVTWNVPSLRSMRSGPEVFHPIEEVDTKLLVPLRTKRT